MDDDPELDPELVLEGVDNIIMDWLLDTHAVLCGLSHAVLNDLVVIVLRERGRLQKKKSRKTFRPMNRF